MVGVVSGLILIFLFSTGIVESSKMVAAFYVLLSVALWGLILYGLFKAVKYAVKRWPELDKEGRRKAMIAGVVGLLLLGGLLIWKPWESQNYKDCVRAHMDEIDGSPGNRRADLEKYCRESADGNFR